ncbi:MAG: hypothetical protein R3F61_27715 [Myxococcota bacterium]
MRNAPISLFAFLAFTSGCNTFETVESACLDVSPGEGNITDDVDRDVFRRMNCYRRLAKRPRTAVNPLVQDAVEAHNDWILQNNPRPETLANENGGSAGFTGGNGVARLTAAGYTFPAHSELLELVLREEGEFASFVVGADHFDFWFADPFVRPAFLQPSMLGGGVVQDEYLRTFPEETAVPDLPISYTYWNLIYQTPVTPYAEIPVIYPRNGQTDAPPVYVHLSSSQSLELGQTYGYPVTFTVGSRETNLQVTQASFRRVSDDAELPITVLTGDDAITALRLRNTAIIVPEQPLTPGATYQADIRIKTDQGERRARTQFTCGSMSRDIPAGLSRMAVELDRPLLDYRLGGRELYDLEE